MTSIFSNSLSMQLNYFCFSVLIAGSMLSLSLCNEGLTGEIMKGTLQRRRNNGINGKVKASKVLQAAFDDLKDHIRNEALAELSSLQDYKNSSFGDSQRGNAQDYKKPQHVDDVLISSSVRPSASYELCAVTVVGGFVTPIRALEWIHWHAVMGVEAFFLLLVAPSPQLLAALSEVSETVQVRLSRFRSSTQRTDCNGKKDNCRLLFRTSQFLGFPWGMSMAKQANCQWAAFLDVDEYITPSSGSVASWFRAREPQHDWVFLRWVEVPVPVSYPPNKSLFGLNQRVSDKKAKTLPWSSSGKSVVRPHFFRDASHMHLKTHETGRVPRGSRADIVPVTTIHQFTPIENASYDVHSRLLVPTSNETILPIKCGYRFTKQVHGCVRIPDTLHIRHYRRQNNRQKIKHESADSTDAVAFRQAVIIPASNEVCRRMNASNLIKNTYKCHLKDHIRNEALAELSSLEVEPFVSNHTQVPKMSGTTSMTPLVFEHSVHRGNKSSSTVFNHTHYQVSAANITNSSFGDSQRGNAQDYKKPQHVDDVLISSSVRPSASYELCAVTVVGGFVTPIRALEWIHWHAVMGVEAFFLLLVVPSPQLLAALSEVSETVQVRLSRFRSSTQRTDCNGKKDNCRLLFRTSQFLGFPWGMSMAKQANCQWTAFLDVDEYITPSSGSVASWFRAREPQHDWVFLRWVEVPVPVSYPPNKSLFGLNQRVSDKKAKTLSWSSSGKSVVRPHFFRDASHMHLKTHGIGRVPRKSRADIVPVTTIHQFTPIEYASYDVHSRLLVPTSNETILPIKCGYRFTKQVHGCVRIPDTLHIRHYRRQNNRQKIKHESADSTDAVAFRQAVIIPASNEVCRRMNASNLIKNTYIC